MYSNRYVLYYIHANVHVHKFPFGLNQCINLPLIYILPTHIKICLHILLSTHSMCAHTPSSVHTLTCTHTYTHIHTHLIRTYPHACYVHTYTVCTFYTQLCISHSIVHLEVRIGTVPWFTTMRGWPTTRPVERPLLYKHCRTYSLRYRQLWPHPLY